MLCETSQSQKDKYRVVAYEVSKLASLRKRKLNVLTKSWDEGEMGTCSVGSNSALQDEKLYTVHFLFDKKVHFMLSALHYNFKRIHGIVFKGQKSLI